MASRSLGTLTVDLLAKTGLLEQGLDKAGRASAKYARDVQRQHAALASSLDTIYRGIGIGAAAAFGAISVSVKKSLDDMISLAHQAKTVGMPTQEFVAFATAAKNAEIPIDAFTSAIQAADRALAQAQSGTGAQSAAFSALGIDPKQVKNNKDLILKTADALSQYADGAGKTAVEMAIFGRAGAQLNSFLDQGAAAISKTADHMKDLNVAFGPEAQQLLGDYDDKMDEFGNAVTGLRNTLAIALLPSLTSATDDLNDFLESMDKEAVSGFAEVVNTLARAIILVGSAGSTVGKTLDTFVGTAFNFGKALFTQTDIRHPIDSFRNLADVLHENVGIVKEYGADIIAQWQKTIDKIAEFGRKAADANHVLTGSEVPAWMTAGLPIGANRPQLNFNPASGTGGADTVAKLADAYAALVKASNQYANSLTANDPLQKANVAMADAVENLAKLRTAYIKAGGSAKLADEFFSKALGGIKSQFSFDLHEPQRQLEQYTKSLDDQLSALSAANDVRIKSMTLGDHEAENMQALAADTADATKELTNFIAAHQLINGKLSANDQASLDALKDFLDKRHRLIAANQDAENAIRSNMGAGWQKGVADFIEETQDKFQQGAQLAQQFTSGFADAFEKFASGAESAKAAFGSFIDDLFAQALRFVANQAIAKLFNAFGGQGRGDNEGALGGIIAAFGGTRAGGGPVAAGGLYQVNENGPGELLSVGGRQYLMMGPQAGTVEPAQRSRGVGGTTINVAVQPTSSRRTADQVATAVARQQRLATARNG